MQATGSLTDRRALVIEGDAGIRQEVCDVLARRGFKVSACDSLGQGREFYRNHPLVVTGCSHENGEVQEFVDFVREQSVDSQPYIITLKIAEEAARAIPGGGINDILAVPLNGQALELKIDAANAWLASRDAHRPAGKPAEEAGKDVVGHAADVSESGAESETEEALEADDELPPDPEEPPAEAAAEGEPPVEAAAEEELPAESPAEPAAEEEPLAEPAEDFVPALTASAEAPQPLVAAVPEKSMLSGTTRYHLAVLVENSPFAMAMFDKSMRYIIANDRWKRAFGIEKDDVIGRSHYEIFSEVSDTWQELCTRCTGRNEEQIGRELVQWADGTREWVKWVMRPWQYEDGVTGGIVVSFDSVEDPAVPTPQNEFETDLSAALAQSNTTPVLVLDAHGRIVRSNHMARELGLWDASYDDERFYWQVYLRKEDRAAAQEAFINFACDVMEKSEFSFPSTNIDDVPCADGNTKRIAWHNLPRHDAGGKINGMIRIGVDVGELSPASAPASVPASADVGSWIDSVPSLHFKVRRDGKIVFFNRAWLEFRDRAEEEEFDNGWLDGLHEDDHPKVAEAFAELEENGGRLNQLARLQNAKGDYRWMRFVVNPDRYGNLADGETSIGYCEDVTAQKHLDEELAKLQDTLEKKESERKELQDSYDNLLGESARFADNVNTQEDRAAALDQELGELRAATAKVTEERNRFAAIPENAPFGIVVLGADGKLLYTNPAHVSVVGSEIKGHPDLESWMRQYCPETDEQAVESFLEDWREHVWRKQLSRTYPLLADDESIRDLEFRPRMMRDGQFLLSIFDVTDTQRGEKALKASEAKLRALFQGCGMAMTVVDRKGDIIDANAAAEKLFGRSRADILKQNIGQFVVEEDRSKHEELLEELAKKRTRSGEAQVRLLAPDDEEVPVSMNVSAVHDSEDEIRFTTYVFNASQVSSKPEEPEPPSASLPRLSPDLIIVSDGEGVIESLIPSPALANRIDPARAAGVRVNDLFPGIGIDVVELGGRAASSGGVAVHPFSLVENQSERRYECRVAPSGDAHLTIVIREAPPESAPRELPDVPPPPADSAVDEALKMQALAFESIHDGVVVADLKGRITDWNAGAQRMFGYAKDEIVGKGLYHLYDQDDPRRFKTRITQGIAKARRWEEETTFVRQDGSLGKCEALYVPLLDEKGAPVALVGVNRELRRAREKAAPAPETPGPAASAPPQSAPQFTGALETVASMLDLQLDAAKDESSRSAMLASHGRVEALAMLQRQAAAAGGPSVPVDFGKYVRALVQYLLEEVGPEETAIEVHLNVKNIALPYDVASSLAVCLNELLTNSLTHAFTGRENGVVGVSMKLEGEGGWMIVKDDGEGIPEWIDIENPSGLGLRIVQRMIGRLGGRMQKGSGPDTEIQIGFQLNKA